MDPQEKSVGGARTVSTSRKRRRLSPTYDQDLLEPTASAPGIDASPMSQNSNLDTPSKIQDILEYSGGKGGGSGGGGGGGERYHLLACGCNLYGQLTSGPGLGIGTEWTTKGDTDWLRNENTDRDGAPAEPTREPNLITVVDTPTIVMTAGESMRVLYLGSHSLCVERDGNIYLRGLLPTFAPGASRGHRELPVPLPPGTEAQDIEKAFGTRWAFLGLILSDGSVYTFSLADWSFAKLLCAATENPVSDIQVNRIGEICFLYSCPSSGSGESGSGGSKLKVYPPLPSITEHLYDASLRSLVSNITTPISIFDMGTDYPGEGVLQGQIFKSIASTSTGFIALTSNGNIYTYGDRRFNSLGRSPDAVLASTSGLNAQGWGQVTALEGISIERISANPGGHVQLALAEDGTAYLWGGDGTENINVPLTSDLGDEKRDEEVVMVDIVYPGTSDPVEFEDLAVGEDHVVLIEQHGKGIWVSGGSDMGQTGFGIEYRCLPTALEVVEDTKKQKGMWRRLGLSLPEGCDRILWAKCGFGCTVLLAGSSIEAS
ncbi:hypothetical protein TWF281_009648 [Arthrobotrys megalospora]